MYVYMNSYSDSDADDDEVIMIPVTKLMYDVNIDRKHFYHYLRFFFSEVYDDDKEEGADCDDDEGGETEDDTLRRVFLFQYINAIQFSRDHF